MQCPECHFSNPRYANFCNGCGYMLTPTTEATSEAFSFDDRLGNIQRYLPKGLIEKILAQRQKIEGERKHVTVMFCDMVHFTPLVARLGPEEAYCIMDQIYEILIREVHNFGGTVNEMTGDGIMALFGAPIALENAPQRSIRSAISVHREIAKFNNQKTRMMPIQMRIGIHTGPVVIGTLGNDLRVEFKAVGETVNLASRMEGLAEAGTTYVTEETFRLTKEFFRFEAMGKKTVKGKVESIPVYKVLSSEEGEYRSRLGSERMIYSEMVGRENELSRLELQVMKAINGEGSVVNIIGEAGIGKSRLVTELKKREVMKRVTLLAGRAISIGRNLSFHPIIDLMKQWAQIRQDDGESTAFSKLHAAVRSLCPERVGEVLPFVATLMGMKLSGSYAEKVEGIEGEALEKLILKNVRELLIKAAERTPMVIVTEDLHWADTSSIELMESLFRLAETQRILFVNVFRPGHKETGNRIIQAVRERLPVYYVEIALKPLDAEMSKTLIANMLDISGPHETVTGQIVGRSGGNPFFIEEFVRLLIDKRAVILKRGKFQVTEEIGRIPIPYTIHEVVISRIESLDEETRNLVKVASVIGRNFFYRVLSEVARTFEDLDGRLSYLGEIEFIRERSRMGEVEYLFKHALTHEVAYESILLEKRKVLHRKVADSIEKVFRERLHEFYGMLAYHYSEAGSLEKAEDYLIKAGKDALRSSASNEALHFYQKALSLYAEKHGDTADPEKVAMLQKNIALAFYNKGQYDKAIEFFDKALNYYWGALPKHLISTVFKLLSALLHLLIALYLPCLKFTKSPTQMDIEVFEAFYKKCKALGIKDPKRFFLELLYMHRRVSDFDFRKFKLSLEVLLSTSPLFSFTGLSFGLSRKILDSVRKKMFEDDPGISIIYDLSEAVHNYLKGNWQVIGDHNRDLVSKNLETGEIYFAAQHLYWHGISSIYRGRLGIAKSIVDELDHIYEVYENDFSLLLKYELNTNLLMECRELHHALIEVDEGIAFLKESGLVLFLFDMYSFKAWIHILMEDLERADSTLQHAIRIRPEVNAVPEQLSNFYRSELEYDLCRFKRAIHEGNELESAQYLKKASKVCKMLLRVSKKAAEHRTEAYKLGGVYYWLIHKQKEALRWWHKAIEEGEGLGANLELSRTYFEVGKRLFDVESKYRILDGVEAEEYLEKARILFEEMDLQWDLDELGRVAKG